MKINTVGGIAALICSATYIFGFALLVTVLAPLGFGTNSVNVTAVVAFIAEQPGLLVTWYSVIYIVNAISLALLVVSIYRHLETTSPNLALITIVFGTIWAVLVLGAGMIANVTVERVNTLATDPEAAAALWEVLNLVELGLGGGNEIAGGVWILSISIAALMSHSLTRLTMGLGMITGIAGLVTIIPVTGEIAGSIFGLGAIVWFIFIGIELLRFKSIS